ncbi:translation factor SUA5 [Halanaerobium saccharolyticum]|uniref:Threonylcarbamoyl-AMP synthase n=1 Tax=Halanaerobium saccharolyticum TaxID=43595 RepID=A0A4R7ZED9_9FIRM|nr:L-threonylcarbamoyladenylate synthase [Halanaerobium saccharolyticum]RAK09828.1 translation factor SUA5 [Halanaerobium saccharolyticum]TDW07390.1 translation factor SUA5 [Halanaerobium saccharolyticum]TDX61269.1 translation factor SUA5 [Halanaerobium saccharolyticum]
MQFKTEIKKTGYGEEFQSESIEKHALDSVLRNKLKEDQAVIEASDLLKNGEIVALPTETVYGLAADAMNPEAVKKIFKAKGRPQDNPLIVHIADKSQLQQLTAAKISDRAEKLMEKFWPGPLTIIFSKNQKVPAVTSAGLQTLAVRMPAHPLMLAVIERSGLALAAPSANTSGFPSPTRAEHVYNDLKGKIPLILDGGPSHFGVESTVIDLRGEQPEVLRPGGVSRREISRVLGEDVILAAELKDRQVLSPGMKYRHYAPQKKLYIFNFEDKISVLNQALKRAESKKIALITARESKIDRKKLADKKIKILKVFNHAKPEELAQKLFDLLRKLDADQSVKEIYIEELETKGIGEAVMNRIYKAAAADDYSQPGGGDN